MKKLLFLLAVTAVFFTHTEATAQNIPDGSTVTGIPTTVEAHPIDFTHVTPALPSPTLYNYQRVYTPNAPMSAIPAHSSLLSTPLTVSTTYVDGWGRPIQSVDQIHPTTHIVTPYDSRARKTQLSYLPYTITGSLAIKFRMQPYTEQENQYLSNYLSELKTAYTKTKSYSDNGLPTTVSYNPGKEFVGENRGVTTTMHIGSSSNISSVTTLYKLEYDATNKTICTTGIYNTSEYTVARVQGQHNTEVLTFTDKSGRTLCKKERSASNTYLTTYYVYNLLGQLVNIVPPIQCSTLISIGCLSNVLPTTTPGQVFVYEYNKYGQKSASQTPGKEGRDKVIYDQYHRVFLSQSPEMSTTSKTYFMLYDKLGRTVMTGLFTDNSGMSEYHYNGIKNGTVSLPNYLDGQGQPIPDQNKLEYWLQHDMPVNNYPVDGNGEPFLHNCEIHTVNYYDRYDQAPGNRSFSTSYSGYYLSGAAAEEPKPYYLVHGEPVASKTRILDNGLAHNWGQKKWITSVFFYDEKGRSIQTHTLNPWKDGSEYWDITTVQYNFTGQKILNVFDHKGNGSGNKGQGTIIVKKHTYEAYNGRLEKTDQQIDGGAWYNINQYWYNDLGQVRSKLLGGFEIQDYKYNISGQLISINEGFVHANAPNAAANKRTYASILNYESGFGQKRYDGKLTGYQWRNQGSTYPMAYGYSYDDAGRMTHAEYRYKNGTSWIKTDMDYTTSNLSYDLNGNIQYLNHRGNSTTSNVPTDIDILDYHYDASGTRLQYVGDSGFPSDSKIHDLVNNNTGINDFAYDKNGNLTQDLNRGIKSSGITYNFQDMPTAIEKTNSDGDVKNIYTADGTLLQKVVTDNTQNPAVVTTYHYWGPFVYKDNDLEMVMHEEGRSVYDGSTFLYDYFVKDHLGNVRSIVKGTMRWGSLMYDVGFELVAATVEEATFDQVAEVRDIKPLGTPGDNQSAILNGSIPGERIGAAIMVHAMAGETFNVSGYGYYEDEDVQNYNTYTMPEYMLESLSDALIGASGEGGEGGTATQTINSLLTSTNYNLYETMKASATNSNYPRAYLNYLVFDENYDLQPQYSSVTQINGAANAWHHMAIPGGNREMEINGYLLVYFSNESAMNVAKDNLNILVHESALVEEHHYYPHGMAIESGQSSIQPENQYLAQGNKLQKELSLYINHFNARQFDAQIGRFMGIDKLANAGGQESLSGYHFCANDPANFVDPTGLFYQPDGRWEELARRNQQVTDKQNEFWNFLGENRYTMMMINPKYLPNGGTGGDLVVGGFMNMESRLFTPNQLGINSILDAGGSVDPHTGAFSIPVTTNKIIGYTPDFVNTIDNSCAFPWVVRTGDRTHGYKPIYQSSTVTGGGNNAISDIWNHPLARMIVPDLISFSFGGEMALGIGLGAQPINFTILTRGENPGVYITPEFNVSGGLSAGIEGSVNITRGMYTGNPRDINAGMLQGPAYGGDVSITPGVGFRAGFSYSPTGDGNSFINSVIGVTGGTKFSISGTIDYTVGYGCLWSW